MDDGVNYVNNLKSILGVKSDEALAKLINCSTPTIRTWKYGLMSPRPSSLRNIEEAISRKNKTFKDPTSNYSPDMLLVYRELDFNGKLFVAALHRICKTNTDIELAKFLGCSASIIRWWKYRNQRPGSEMVQLIKDAICEIEITRDEIKESSGV